MLALTELPLLVPTECPLLVPTECPFDVFPPLEADEPRRASNDLFFADELFFTNKFQNCEGVSKLGTETNPRELVNEYFELIHIKKYSIFFFFLKIRNYGLASNSILTDKTHDKTTKADPVERIGFRFKA